MRRWVAKANECPTKGPHLSTPPTNKSLNKAIKLTRPLMSATMLAPTERTSAELTLVLLVGGGCGLLGHLRGQGSCGRIRSGRHGGSGEFLQRVVWPESLREARYTIRIYCKDSEGSGECQMEVLPSMPWSKVGDGALERQNRERARSWLRPLASDFKP